MSAPSQRPDCACCDLWRRSRNTCGILALLDLPPLPSGSQAQHWNEIIRRPRTWFDAITAPHAEPNHPGFDPERARAAIASIGNDDAAARSYLQGDEATCAARQPLRRINAPTGEAA